MYIISFQNYIHFVDINTIFHVIPYLLYYFFSILISYIFSLFIIIFYIFNFDFELLFAIQSLQSNNPISLQTLK